MGLPYTLEPYLKPDLTVSFSPSSNVCHVLCTITRVNLRIHITQYIGRNIHYYYPENLPCKKSLCAVCVRMISYYPEIILTFIPTYFLAIFSRLLDTRFGSFGIRGENKGYPLNAFQEGGRAMETYLFATLFFTKQDSWIQSRPLL